MKLKNKKILSGDASKKMWEEINRIQYDEIVDALYSIACKCQELEAKVDKLLK